MTGQILAVANMKGGVGKTTTVVSLAETIAAATDEPVLVIDLDPQASASIAIAGDDALASLIKKGRSLEVFLEQRLIRRQGVSLVSKVQRAGDVTHRGQPLNLSLLACGPHLRITEREILIELIDQNLGFRAVETKICQELQREFEDLRRRFSYVILDCAPGISPVTEAAIRLSDAVVVPTIADFLSVMGLNAFCRSLWDHDPSRFLPMPAKPHVLVTRWQQNVRQQRDFLEQLVAEAEAEDAHFGLFKTRVPQSAALASALGKTGTQAYRDKYGSDVVNTLASLIKELKEVIVCRSTSTAPPSSGLSQTPPKSSRMSIRT
ncbi:ParA family protein [Rhodoplanes sp. TEM]|uniref:ParA family protein n=1 Tax=Rhodoplanes tepidamans TaxID=200616 RepID=A0ABT5J5D0_RHOTP|nr:MULTISPECIES: ParA family protein [Rhodoplanes]MDC7784860.1 ParA family protein [Rhodoplanes tepidamans]MDC7986046.1 ParA family protein [Rhodoplanes sp. TEM]MDQ0353913.1 cellulose biosynthesis protein BcsQ [Rhodoplanes tepidamans]